MATTEARRIETDGERKQVTVLFADVMGSMDMAEQQDPEEWREIMQRFFSILSEAVHRFEGTVDKFTGDGIMAVFGAPIAHEDHAQRACYAALRMLEDISEYAAELRRKHGLNFSARIGINSGEVVAGAIGDGGDGNYTAIGHTVGLAQRMEALAEPGKAYLTEAAAELARGFLDLEDLGEFEIKGASRPVRVFELTGVGSARSRLDLSRERGFSRFVGRKPRRWQALEEALEAAQAGAGAVIGIVAEAGRRQEPPLPRVRRALPGPRDRGLRGAGAGARPGDPVRAGAADAARLLRRSPIPTPERIAREKIAGRALLLDPGLRRRPAAPLRLPRRARSRPPPPQLSPEARQRSLRGRRLHASSAPRTAARRSVNVIEDLHWMDEGSDALLGELLGSVDGTKTLAIVNYRPEYTPRWAELAELPPDPARAARARRHRELLRDLVGDDPSLDGLAELIHERTAGNPFFIEEIVRELARERVRSRASAGA